MKHSTVVGGSSAERVLHCPGSVALVSIAPPQPSSDAADRGSMLHDAMATILDQELDPEKLFGFQAYGFTLGREELEDAIYPALAAFDALDEEFGGIEFCVERQVSFGDKIPGAFGTADIVGESKNFGHVLDWKFGFKKVVAKNNAQGKFYACAARNTPGMAEFLPRDKDVMISIVQPQVSDHASSWVVSHDELDVFELQLITAVRKARQPDAQLEVGPWCHFCPAQALCPLKNELAHHANGIVVDDLEPQELTPDELGELLTLAREVSDWASAVEKLAHGAMDLGQGITGYKLVEKKAQRKWNSEAEAEAQFKKMRIPQKDFRTAKLKSPAQMEKVLKALHRVDVLEDLINRKTAGTAVVPVDDDRPAVFSGASALSRLAKVMTGD